MSEAGAESDDAMRLDDLQEQNLDSVRGSGVPDIRLDLQDQQLDTFHKGDDGDDTEQSRQRERERGQAMTQNSNEDDSPDEAMLLDGLQSQELDTIFESDPEPGITFDLQEQDVDSFEHGDDSD